MSREHSGRRLDETVREKLAVILTEEISDPRLDFVTLTGVKVSSDQSYADVYVTTAPGDESYDRVLDGLNSAKGRIRSLLAGALSTRAVPELRFHIDESVDRGEAIDAALQAVPPTLAAQREAELAEAAEESGTEDE